MPGTPVPQTNAGMLSRVNDGIQLNGPRASGISLRGRALMVPPRLQWCASLRYAWSSRHVDVDIVRRMTRQPIVRENTLRDRPSKVDVLVVPAPANRGRIDLKDDHRKSMRVDARREVLEYIGARLEYDAQREGIEQEGLLTREDRPES